jgi:Glycosyl hydrolase catalytic core
MKSYFALGILCLSTCSVNATQSKRGFIATNTATQDLSKYLASLLLNWTYDYAPQPFLQGTQYPYGSLSFVPMLWGQQNANSFLSTVKSEPDYHYVLGFNEPDMPTDSGGSDLSVSNAVSLWQSQIQPLSQAGYKLGSPAGTLC